MVRLIRTAASLQTCRLLQDLISQLQLPQQGASSPTFILRATWKTTWVGHSPWVMKHFTSSGWADLDNMIPRLTAVGPEVEIAMGSEPISANVKSRTSWRLQHHWAPSHCGRNSTHHHEEKNSKNTCQRFKTGIWRQRARNLKNWY